MGGGEQCSTRHLMPGFAVGGVRSASIAGRVHLMLGH